jgi:hypothetical protein
LIASSSAIPELIAFGTNITPYFSSLAVPTTVLALTDRLAVRYYVTPGGRTLTLHTEGPHLCQIITTFTTGLTSLNGLSAQVQFFAVGTSGTDFNIASATATHTFNLPTASATNRGALSSADWSMFNAKENAITAGTTAQYFRGDKTFQTLNTSVVPELTNLYYTEARVNANTNVAANTAARHNAVTLGTANGLILSTQVLSLGLASAGVTGALSGTDWSTFNSKQNALTLTTTGTSGAATLLGSTLNIPQYQAAGTYITNVTASSPLFSSGGTTPNITIQQASGSQNGFLSSTDWTTFNNKQNALTNPVTGTGTSGQVAYFNGTTSITSESNLFWDATNDRLGIGTATPDARLQIVGAFAQQIRFGTNQSVYTNISMGTGFTTFDSIGGDSGAYSFRDDGETRMFINSSGNVLINTTTDAGFKLDVNGTGRFSSNLTASGTGNIVIQAISSNNFPLFQLQDNRAGGNTWNIEGGRTLANLQFRSSIAGGTVLELASTGAATFSSSVSVGDFLRLTKASSVDIQAYTGSSYTNLFYDAASHNWQTSGGTAKMVLTAGGNVLIGTTSDAGFKLNVNGTGRFSGALQVASNITAINGAIEFSGSGSAPSTDPAIYRVGGVNSLAFAIGSIPRLTIASTGAATFSNSVTATSFFESSDATLKTLVQNNYQANGIESVVAKLYIKNGKQELGYFAQDLQGILPSAVSKGSDGLLNLSYREVHTAKIAYLEEEIRQIKKRYEIN